MELAAAGGSVQRASPGGTSDDAVELLRCGGCAGAFVPRESYGQLVLEGPPGYSGDGSSALARFVAWLRAHLGSSS